MTTRSPRLTPSVIARLRALPADALAKILAALGIRRDTPPPPVNDWPQITKVVKQEWGAIDLPKSSVGIHYSAFAPPGKSYGMVTLLGYQQGVHSGVLLDNCMVSGAGDGNWCGRWYECAYLIVRRSKFIGAIKEHYIYAGSVRGGLYEDLQFGELGKKNAGGAWCQQALRNIIQYRLDGSVEHDYSMETGNEGVLLSQQETTRIYRRIKAHHISWQGSPRQGAFGLSEHYGQLWLPKPDGTLDKSKVHGFINAHILIEDCEFIGGHMNYTKNGVPVRSNRQLLVQGRPSLTMTGTYINAPYPEDGWIARINNVKRVEITKCEIECPGGKIEITDPGSVRIADCTGYTWVTVLKGGQPVYAGPISKDVTL